MSTTTTAPATKNATTPAPVSTNEMGCYPRCKCMCDSAFCACREGAHKIVEPSAEHRSLGARVSVR